MLFSEPIFVGIDATAPRSSYSYAALDGNLNLVALAEGALDEVSAFLGGQQSVTVAINAPSGTNRGLVGARSKKEILTLQKSGPTDCRLAEYELRKRGIVVPGTPSSVAASPTWIRAGFSLYRKLSKIGFEKYPADGASYQMFETHSHACYCVLAEGIPQSRQSLEGKIQRQLLLYERGLQIKDPMEFFEEITRFKMMRGVWPHELLYHPRQLDALVAAYTAWVSMNKPAAVSFVGDEKEGRIVLPERNLKGKY